MNKHGVPAIALVISSALVSLLVITNFGHGLVDAFQIIVLIGTMTTLVPYMLCAAGLLQLMVDRREVFPAGLLIPVIVSIIAFVFSIWALYGSGRGGRVLGLPGAGRRHPDLHLAQVAQRKSTLRSPPRSLAVASPAVRR